MVLRLDPRFPLVWRTPSSVQFGVDPPVVVLEGVTETQERMLAALTVGVGQPGLAMIARDRRAEREALLHALAPVLAGPEPSAAVPTVTVCGGGPLVSAIAGLLAESGVQAVVAAEVGEFGGIRPDLAIVTGHFVLAPELHAFWLRRDVPHLPVVVGDAGVTVGPVVEPGAGPCLLCMELHRRDADPAWPAIASQLLGRRSLVESAVLAAETAALTVRMVLARLRDGGDAGLPLAQPPDATGALSIRIDAATGARSRCAWDVHPECGCRGIELSRTPELADAPA